MIGYLRAHPDAGITKEYPGTSGVENLPTNEIIAYPSPTDGIIRFISNSSMAVKEVSAINYFGMTVGSWKNTDEINIAEYQGGIYLLRITSSSGAIIMQKIIKN